MKFCPTERFLSKLTMLKNMNSLISMHTFDYGVVFLWLQMQNNELLFFRHRIKGNEFFKCCDFQQAIAEYNTSLTYESSAAVYNNRALVCTSTISFLFFFSVTKMTLVSFVSPKRFEAKKVRRMYEGL